MSKNNAVDRDIPEFIGSYWGKAQPATPCSPAWHPLVYHSLDVAAVAELLLERSPGRLAWMAAALGVEPAALKPLVVLLVALHDIGKLSADFQRKFEISRNAPPLAPPPKGRRHDVIGYDFLQRQDLGPSFERVFGTYVGGNLRLGIQPLWAAVTGHHGEPPIKKNTLQYALDSAEIRACEEVVAAFAMLSPPVGEPFVMKNTKLVSWALAGLTNVADWIGSNQTWFPYHAPNGSLAEYWRKAREQAAIAVDEAGILPSLAPPAVTARALLPHITGDLSPLQNEASECKLPDGPMLALIEDVTGAGKTEAALIIAARLMAQRRASGLFFALPTMATANAMYERLKQSYKRLFTDGSAPSLVLAHGKRALHEGFRASILQKPGAQDDAAANDDSLPDDTPADLPATAACAAWIADDRRKAFLADVGVGTIDQALLGVLPSRFQALRLWGLADRILICDEVHSFDSYLGRELETLLEFQAALGGSAIVLSATLSTEARQRIVAAFQRGLKCDDRQPNADASYPLLTLVGREEEQSIKVGTRPEVARDLVVRRIGTADEAVRYIAEMSRRGATVAWIRNAVDDCVEARDMLRAAGVDPILLHARFAMCDRLAIESEVLRRLGKDSSRETRRNADGSGVVVVGSQILEASLDYDVDVMVTDLAPVDMVIQRAGRLWRHPWRNKDRPIGLDERALVLLSPDPGVVDDQDWYRTLSSRAAAVYPDHGYVWRSAKALTEGAQGQISTPGGLRNLLAQVYGEDIAPPVPAELDRASLNADGERRAARSIAANNSLNLSQGYGGNNALFESDTITPTRLGEPVTVFRLAKREAGCIVPWHAVADAEVSLARAWALSECAVRAKSASGVPAPGRALADETERAKQAWPKWEREQQPLLLLEPGEDGIWRGRVTAGDSGEREVLYDSASGLRIPRA